MARKPIIPIRVDAETKERWEAAAAEHSTSLSEYVRAAVEEKIERGVKPMSLVTKGGRVLTEEDIQKLADEAERGYDLGAVVERSGGKRSYAPDPKGGKPK